MFVRNPACPALETVDSTDSVSARAQSTALAAGFESRDVRAACVVARIECLLAPIQTKSAGKSHALTAVLRAWTNRAAEGRRRARAYHRKRPHEPTLPLQSALDFAALNVRFNRAASGSAYALAPPDAGAGASRCPHRRKALYTALLGFALTAPAYSYECAVSELGMELAAASPYAAVAAVDDPRLVLILKHGLRGATALFARHSSTVNASNVATMTAGIRN